MTKAIFTTPQQAEAAFYEALERADLEAMMSVWAEDEEIVCVHPTGPRLAGYAAVRESWRQIFSSGGRTRISLSHQVEVQSMLVAVHSLHENFPSPSNERKLPPVVATNVYVRGPLGWRMLVHHASPAPAGTEPVSETPKTVH